MKLQQYEGHVVLADSATLQFGNETNQLLKEAFNIRVVFDTVSDNMKSQVYKNNAQSIQEIGEIEPHIFQNIIENFKKEWIVAKRDKLTENVLPLLMLQ